MLISFCFCELPILHRPVHQIKQKCWSLDVCEELSDVFRSLSNCPVIGCEAASSDVLCCCLTLCIMDLCPVLLMMPVCPHWGETILCWMPGPQLKYNMLKTGSVFHLSSRPVCVSVCASAQHTFSMHSPPHTHTHYPSVVTHRRTAIKLFAHICKPLSCASLHHFMSSLAGLNGLSVFHLLFFVLKCVCFMC